MNKEYYHTKENFDSVGLDRFLEHIEGYAMYERAIPMAKTVNTLNGKDIHFMFSDVLLNKFLENPSLMKKPYESALKYGFRGFSDGGRNGIFNIKKSDKGLLKPLPTLISKYNHEINENLEDNLDSLKPVKIVCHTPSGERIIGLHDNTMEKILFLDFAKY